MQQRGRPGEDANVVIGGFGQRPEPSADLNERQKAIWRETAASEPADFFNTAALRAILSDYCCHRECAESISEIITGFKPEWLRSEEGARRYHGLLKMRDLEMRASLSCATKLRMTNQARYTPQAAATASKNTARVARPWERELDQG
jgi:hypothetical protein